MFKFRHALENAVTRSDDKEDDTADMQFIIRAVVFFSFLLTTRSKEITDHRQNPQYGLKVRQSVKRSMSSNCETENLNFDLKFDPANIFIFAFRDHEEGSD